MTSLLHQRQLILLISTDVINTDTDILILLMSTDDKAHLFVLNI